MRAAVVTGFDRPLDVVERPVPEVGAGRVLVRVVASGLCHTDIHAARGDWPVKPVPPFVPVPDAVSSLDAAPLTCAGVTTYKAVKVAGLRPTERAAIFGIGGLGHLALQYARIFGAETVAVDVTQAKLALAEELGADHVVNAAETDPVEAITALGGADVAIVLAATPAVLEQAHAALRRGGRLVLVSLPKDNTMRLPVFETVLGGLTVIGSIVGTREDLAEVFRLHAAGRTRVDVEVRKLDEVNDAIEDVLAGRVTARVVFEL